MSPITPIRKQGQTVAGAFGIIAFRLGCPLILYFVFKAIRSLVHPGAKNTFDGPFYPVLILVAFAVSSTVVTILIRRSLHRKRLAAVDPSVPSSRIK